MAKRSRNVSSHQLRDYAEGQAQGGADLRSRSFRRTIHRMKLVPFCAVALFSMHMALAPPDARAGQLPPGPFTMTLSNNTPLAFGMTPTDAATALGSPLAHVSGRLGNEVFLAIRTNGGSGFFPRKDRLYLQFRKGQLTGWKGDWGHNWMWQ